MLAYNGVGWGGLPQNKVISDLGLEIGVGHPFPFPPGTSHDNGLPKGSDIENETNNIKTQRSISAPNVSHTIINPESILTEYGNKFGKIPQDHVRSKLPMSNNITLNLPDLAKAGWTVMTHEKSSGASYSMVIDDKSGDNQMKVA